MRPLLLTIRGFRSHRDESRFDFRGRSLVGIVGPTGAGKSSVLDAISFGLYGRTPGEGRAAKKLINARCEEAQIELWFSASDECLRVVRVLRQRGASLQALERWDEVEGSKLETISDKQSQITEQIEQRLGLDFEGFTRSVLLAQDRFAELLRATPAEAARVLTGLFGFGVVERMKAAAEARMQEMKTQLAILEKARDAQERLSAEVAVATIHKAQAAEALARIDVVVAEIDEIGARREGLEAVVASTRQRKESLEVLVGGIPPTAERAKALLDITEHADRVEAAKDAWRAAVADTEAAVAALDAAITGGLEGGLARLEHAIRAGAEATRAAGDAERAVAARRRDLATAEERLAETSTAVAAAEAVKLAAVTASTTIAAELASLESAHAAHGLAEGLAVGEECPVCLRPVEELPPIETPGRIDDARTRATEAAAATERATDSLEACRRDLATADLSVENAKKALADAEATRILADEKATAASQALATCAADVGGKAADPLGSLEAARAHWESLVAAKAAAAERLKDAETALSSLADSDTPTRLADLVDRVRPAAAEAGVAIPGGVEAGALGRIIDETESLLAERLRVTVAELADLEGRVEALRGEEAARLEAAGLPPDADARVRKVEAGKEVARAEERERLLMAQVAAGEEALTRATATGELARHIQRLNADLAPGKFPQFLLDERRRELAAAGSTWFAQLTSGRYEFELADSQFKIKEVTAAGIVRDADTLSGGETFLASLSLALGLATLVSMGGGALDSFFIDEGFGSLDADSLDLAMAGVEELVSRGGNRLVLVVSHVPELRERIEDLIELGKDPATNETVVIRS